MGFINDQGVIAIQKPVGLGFGQEDAVGHHFNKRCLLIHAVRKSDFIPHGPAQGFVHFRCNALSHGHGCDPAGLGAADQPVNPPAGVNAEFGELGGFSGTGFPGNNDYLVLFYGRNNIIPPGHNGQVVIIGEGGAMIFAPGFLGGGVVQLFFQGADAVLYFLIVIVIIASRTFTLRMRRISRFTDCRVSCMAWGSIVSRLRS